MRTRLSVLLTVSAALWPAAIARATIFIGVEDQTFVVGSGPHVIPVKVWTDAGDRIWAFDLIMDSNLNAAPGPIISATDLNGPGTLYGNDPHPSTVYSYGSPFDPPTRSLLQSAAFNNYSYDTLPANSPATADVLAFLTIDLTSASTPPGSYALRLQTDDFGPSMVASATGFPPLVLDGATIHVIPEPSTLCLAMVATLSVAALARRRKPGHSLVGYFAAGDNRVHAPPVLLRS
jgi:hypothetical protein